MNPALARRLWAAIEPLHGVIYFNPEGSAVAGLKGFWMGYVAGRVAPVGSVDASTGHALFFAFSRRRIARALPDAWSFSSPADVVSARLAAGAAILRRALPGLDPSPLTELLEDAIEGCSFEGRALAAGWSSVPRPEDPVARLWLAATVLREHRGDGHVMAVVHHGLSGLEAGVTHVATGRVSREQIQTSRAWTDEEWSDAVRRLAARGLLDESGGLTRSGEKLRRDIEESTDRLAVIGLGNAATEAAIALAAPLSDHLFATGVFPESTPIGLRRAAP
ncbi:hypothetical protein ACIBG8_45760 [Nonomuraea sp. NPDC050556]|uniref:SCO6745 family protein n=1 Tax=Nonomuraea sp. NPDC050556 TaxID=3364369 RepID=UPI00378EA511